MADRLVAPSAAATGIALRFAAALQAGGRPSIEAAIDSAPLADHRSLFHSLLIAEVNSRRSRGESPMAGEYLPRFPTHADIVRSLLPAVAVGRLLPIVEPLDPEPSPVPVVQAVPVAAAFAAVPLATPVGTAQLGVPVAQAFEDFEPEPDPAFRPLPPRRRSRARWLIVAAVVLVVAGGGAFGLRFALKKPKSEQPPPGGPDLKGTAVATNTAKPTPKVDPKTLTPSEAERALADWVVRLDGSGTLAMDAGGRRPFSRAAPLPKGPFAVVAFSLPADVPPRWDTGDLTLLPGRDKLASIQLQHPTALTDAGLEPLLGLPLQTLDLRGPDVQVTGAFLVKFPTLTSLTLLSAPKFSDADVQAMSRLPKLTSLAINTQKMTSAGFKDLKTLPLRSLTLGDGVKVTAEDVREMQALTALEEFEADAALGDDAFLEFAVIQTLRKIRLRNAKITDAGMKVVAGLGKLEELQLLNCGITGPGLDPLTERKGLKILDLAGAKLENEALGKLIALSSLKELYLAGCPVTDAGAILLAQIDGLEILDLAGTHVTDKTLGVLTKHGTLKTLDLSGTKVSQAAITAFERATPQCKVVTNSRK